MCHSRQFLLQKKFPTLPVELGWKHLEDGQSDLAWWNDPWDVLVIIELHIQSLRKPLIIRAFAPFFLLFFRGGGTKPTPFFTFIFVCLSFTACEICFFVSCVALFGTQVGGGGTMSSVSSVRKISEELARKRLAGNAQIKLLFFFFFFF